MPEKKKKLFCTDISAVRPSSHCAKTSELVLKLCLFTVVYADTVTSKHIFVCVCSYVGFSLSPRQCLYCNCIRSLLAFSVSRHQSPCMRWERLAAGLLRAQCSLTRSCRGLVLGLDDGTTYIQQPYNVPSNLLKTQWEYVTMSQFHVEHHWDLFMWCVSLGHLHIHVMQTLMILTLMSLLHCCENWTPREGG